MSDLSSPSVSFNSPLSEVASFYNESVQLKHLACELTYPTDELVLVKIPKVLAIHYGGAGGMAVNGGVISFIFDLALGVTAYMVKNNAYYFSATTRINIELTKALKTSSVFTFAKIIQVKKNLIYSEAWVENDNGLICARATGILFTKSERTMTNLSNGS